MIELDDNTFMLFEQILQSAGMTTRQRMAFAYKSNSMHPVFVMLFESHSALKHIFRYIMMEIYSGYLLFGVRFCLGISLPL